MLCNVISAILVKFLFFALYKWSMELCMKSNIFMATRSEWRSLILVKVK